MQGGVRMKEKLSAWLKSKNGAKLLFIFGMIGILLIFASSVFPGREAVTKTADTFDEKEYRKELEADIAKLVEGICGDPAAIVTVTLETGIIYEYADEIKQNSAEDQTKTTAETEQTYITVKDEGGGEKPLLITSYMPKIRGVSIVCETEEKRVEEIKNAVCAALDISSRKIYLGRKTGQ